MVAFGVSCVEVKVARAFVTAVLLSTVFSLAPLGASETLVNTSGGVATGVVVTFSERVRIASYDMTVFPDQDPTGRSDTFTFSGGELATRAGFELSWTPTSATLDNIAWQRKRGAGPSWHDVFVPASIGPVSVADGGLWMLEWATARLWTCPVDGSTPPVAVTLQYEESVPQSNGLFVRDGTAVTALRRSLDALSTFDITRRRELTPLRIGDTHFTSTEIAGLSQEGDYVYVMGYRYGEGYPPIWTPEGAVTSFEQCIYVYDAKRAEPLLFAPIRWETQNGQPGGECAYLAVYHGMVFTVSWNTKEIAQIDLTTNPAKVRVVSSGYEFCNFIGGGWLSGLYLSDDVVCIAESRAAGTTIHVSQAPAGVLASLTQAAVPPVVLGADREIPGLEYLGNPFAARLPDGSGWEHARIVYDMQTFGDRVYLAHGSSQGNSGPTPVWYWDCSANTFVHEFTADDEEIYEFRVVEDEMLFIGGDATESWDFGNVYTYDGAKWTKLRTLPHALHGISIWRFGTDLFATIRRELGVKHVFRSSDGGLTWVEITVPPDVAGLTQLFEFRGRLYLTAAVGSVLLEFDGERFVTVTGLSLFPGSLIGEEFPRGYGMARFELFGDALLYVGRSGDVHSAAYVLREMSVDGVTKLPLGNVEAAGLVGDEIRVQGEEVYDVVVQDGVCWVLTNEMHSDDIAATVRVYSSPDLGTWTKVLEFQSPTAATAFEVCGGHVYFGLGPAHPHTYYDTTFGANHPACGDIFRYRLP